MLTTVNAAGSMVSRPLAVQDVQQDGEMWFITHRDTSQVSHIASNPTVNVTFTSRSEWVSVAGTAVVVEDKEKTHELWNQVVDAWFPDGSGGKPHGGAVIS